MPSNNIWGDVLQSIAPNQNIRDYQHAARTFVDSLYRLSPKYSTLFHVFIDIDPNVSTGIDQTSQIETGLMAKEVQLPKFSVQTKVHNAYNRKSIQQEKINYDPISITFHDDSDDIVRKFWYTYYSYYYRDSDYDIDNFSDDSKYKKRDKQSWGYTPQSDLPGNRTLISSIRIYSLHQKRFSSYTLIRPMIQSFQHGQHTAGEYQPMSHTMTVNYESVLYQTGPVSNGTVLGFSDIHYDNTPSPLRNLGAGIGSVKNVIENIKNGDFGSAVQNAIGGVNIFTGSNAQLKQASALDLSSIGNNILKGRNPLSSIFVPTSSTVQNGLSKATSLINIQSTQGTAK